MDCLWPDTGHENDIKRQMTQNDKQTLLPMKTSTSPLLTLPSTAPAVGKASSTAQRTLSAWMAALRLIGEPAAIVRLMADYSSTLPLARAGIINS
jgi:hypothetical protein